MMKNIEHEIMQAKASLDLAEILFKRKDCSESEVLMARNKYNLLISNKKEIEQKGEIESTIAKVVLYEKAEITADNREKMAALLNEANVLRKQMADISNRLEDASDDELLELLPELNRLNVLKEKKWTEYRYIQRNGVTLQQDTEIDIEQPKTAELLALEAQKRSLMEKRSKARAYLKNEISEKKRIKYQEIELACDAEIISLENRIKVLK